MTLKLMMLLVGMTYAVGADDDVPSRQADPDAANNPYTLTEYSVDGQTMNTAPPQPSAAGGGGDDCPYSFAPMDITGGGTAAAGGPEGNEKLYSLVASITWLSQTEQAVGGDYTMDAGFPNASYGPVTCYGTSGIDCNNNGIDDECDIAAGLSLDRDGNCQPDECDDCVGVDQIANACRIDCDDFDGACQVTGCGESMDADGNGTPDECDPDCDGDGIPNSIDEPTFRFYVDADAPDSGDGTSWESAFNDLQDAICEARALQPYCTPETCTTCSPAPNNINDSVSAEIWVADGVYTPSPDDRTEHFRLTTCVAMYGGFDGTESERDQRNPAANPTILSGDLAGDDDQIGNAENSFHVVSSVPEGGIAQDSSAIVDGFYVSGGNANGATTGNRIGGGLYTITASPAVANTVFEDNFALNQGGGVGLVQGSVANFDNCEFRNNTAQLGGAFSAGSSVAATVSRSLFESNSAVIGAIQNSGSGGAFYAQLNSTPELVDVTFAGNSAQRFGGAVYTSSAQTRIINAAIFNNTAGNAGGGLYDANSFTDIHSATIAGNYADNTDGPVTGGGGIGGENSTASIVNAILWGNSAAQAADTEDAQIGGDPPGISYSIVEGLDQFDLPVSGNFDADPEFVDLPGGDVQLMSTSPAIDRGDRFQLPLDPAAAQVGVAAPLMKDLGGSPRVAGPELDLGAFEQFVCSTTFMLDPDWPNFFDCQTGPLGKIMGGLCECYDLDSDGHIGVLDYGQLQSEFGN